MARGPWERPSRERETGAIELLDPSGKATVGTVTLVRCGIFSLEPAPIDGRGGGASRDVAELYAQGVQIDSKSV